MTTLEQKALRHYTKWLLTFTYKLDFDEFVSSNSHRLQSERESLHPEMCHSELVKKTNFVVWTHDVWEWVVSMYDWLEDTKKEIEESEAEHAKHEEFATE